MLKSLKQNSEIKLSIGRDVNGNKVLKIRRIGCRGFSIQTNGNLPKSHNISITDLSKNLLWENSEVKKELIDYVNQHGSARQKVVLKIEK